MPDFEYANARLRAMRANLLNHAQLAQLSQSGSLAEFTRRLAQTPYQHALEASFLYASELDMVLEAVRQDFHATVQKIRGFFRDERLIALVLRPYDAHNLKSVLRGLAQHASPESIRASFYPPGEISEYVLAELLPSANPRAAIDRLASLGHPYAQPLVALRASRPGADTFDMDLAIDQWWHSTARRGLRDARGSEWAGTLTRWLDLEADRTNLMVILRFIQHPAERRALAARFGSADLERLLVAPGQIPADRLAALAQMKTVPAVVQSLGGSPYQAPLTEAIPAYQQHNRLSILEAALLRFQARWQAGQMARDPLGAGVLLAFLALKNAECANLRRIAAGLWRGAASEQIRAGLEEPL